MYHHKSKIKSISPSHHRSASQSYQQVNPYPSSTYPGLENSPLLPTATNANLPLPVPANPVSQANSPSIDSALKGLNFEQIKGIVNRMGGIEGVVANMNKMQRLFAGFQQMAPMFKMLFSSFGSKKQSASQLSVSDERPYRKSRYSSPIRKRTYSSYRRKRNLITPTYKKSIASKRR